MVNLNEENSSEWYLQFIKQDDLVFDVGANYGNRTLEFLKLGAKVISIEPQEDCIRQLHQNFSHFDNFKLLGVALGEKNGMSEMYLCEVNTISTLSTYGVPDFCKIDVEG